MRPLNAQLRTMRRSFAASRAVDQPLRYLLRARFRRGQMADYTVSGRRLRLRHDFHETGVFHEIFVDGVYDLPDGTHPAPTRVADLGGNIGLFALHAAVRWPGVSLVAFEPNRVNANRYRWMLSANSVDGELIEACVATAEGAVWFSGENDLGRVGAENEGTEVRSVDVFDYLDGVELVKMDIEGSEWPILADERFARIPAHTVFMEYHPHLCPATSARAEAQRLLAQAGYQTTVVTHDEPTGVGMLRASR